MAQPVSGTKAVALTALALAGGCTLISGGADLYTTEAAGAAGGTGGSGGTGGTGATGGGGMGATGGGGGGECDNSIKDGSETDVDCGGAQCPACADGLDCNESGDCTSGHCADDICCDAPCDGVCEACSAANTSGADGTCADIPSGLNPDGECSIVCDGAGACQCGSGVTGTIVHGTEGPSCSGGLTCGGISCCENNLLPSGTFAMGRSVSGCDAAGVSTGSDQPEHVATVAGFYLDRFEVTVGRFRKFVNQYNGTAPASGAGAHPLISGSGWNSAWDSELPSNQAALKTNLACGGTYSTWTDDEGSNESYAISCVSWHEAFAFCSWDGGRLPTEAEWEYAAAGGADNRLHPWGQAAPTAEHVSFEFSGETPFHVVGSFSAGQGRWGHDDLSGNMSEWMLDWFADDWYGPGPGNPCNNCANLSTASGRVRRGGGFYNDDGGMRSADRHDLPIATDRREDLGFRCARTQ